MKPILYEANETEFVTNGLGRLSDAITCKVTEERNGAYELEMVYPISGIHYADITYSRIIYAKPADAKGPQPFQIYQIERPIGGKVTVRAEHISYRMSAIPVEPFSATGVNTALAGLNSHAVEKSPFEFWTDKSTDSTFSFDTPQSMRSLLGGQEGSIIDAFGGEWEFDHFTAKLWNERGQDRGVTLRYAKNLTDLKQEESIASTYTGILPYWKGNVEIEGSTTSEEKLVMLDERVVYSENADKFPYHRTVAVDFSSEWEDEPTQDQLRSSAESYVKNNKIGVPAVSVTVSFIPLWQTEEYKNLISVEHVNLCDTVHIEYEALGVSAEAKVIKTVFNVLTEHYDSIELGESRSTLSSDISAAISDISDKMENEYSTKTLLQKSVDRASRLITGGLGGYVYIKPNADGQPEEILIMEDDPDYTKAQHIWRWNKNGLGYSSTGYDGEYRTAITADGHIVADFVDTGSLLANVITTGIIKDVKGLNYWNLDTGELSISSQTKYGSSTLEKTFNSLTSRISDVEGETSQITQLSNEISSKVSKGDVISEINQSAESVKISASKIDLSGNTSLEGTFTSRSGGYNDIIRMDDGRLIGYNSSGSQTGLLDLCAQYGSSEDVSLTASNYLYLKGDRVVVETNSGYQCGYFDSSGFHGTASYSESTGKLGGCTNIWAGSDSSGTWVGFTINGSTYFARE